MKRAIIGIASIIGLVLVAGSCSMGRYLNDGDYYFLENDGAVMPVWVAGNISSDTFIITTHGGPGATSGHEFPLSLGFQYLEEDYALVYWDQRMSGMSQGDPDPSTLTIEQHIEDLGMVVQLIRELYAPASLFLLGHSWGGVMTGGYLGTDNNQNMFNGWIDLDGSLQEYFDGQAQKTWILDRVPAVMAESEDPEVWQYIIDWYEEHPEPLQSDEEPYWYSGYLGGYAHHWEETQAENPTPYVELAFCSPFTFAFYWTQYSDTTWADGYDVTAEVSAITIPALLLWGKEDGIVTAEVGQLAHDILGTDPTMKHLVLVEESAHSPHYDAPDAFYAYVRDFVETYK